MTTRNSGLCSCFFVLLAACVTQPAPLPATADKPDLGVLWVRDAAEWEALALQAYGAATEDLAGLLEDRSFSALPGQQGAADLPPAIIVDVDETVVSNVLFQLAFQPPFANHKLDAWNAANPSLPVPGAARFLAYARASGVAVFYVTNRACAPLAGFEGACPQERITIDDLVESGMPADAAHVLLANETPAWTREKKVRRDDLATRFRIVMLIGDDLGDFMPCARTRVVPPCTAPASAAQRRAWTRAHGARWGNGWYVLPNPMHGSWTSAE